jgi:hypothetical protein
MSNANYKLLAVKTDDFCSCGIKKICPRCDIKSDSSHYVPPPVPVHVPAHVPCKCSACVQKKLTKCPHCREVRNNDINEQCPHCKMMPSKCVECHQKGKQCPKCVVKKIKKDEKKMEEKKKEEFMSMNHSHYVKCSHQLTPKSNVNTDYDDSGQMGYCYGY